MSYFLCHVTVNLKGSLWLVRPEKGFSDFKVWYVDRGRRLLHDSMPYDLIQGQGQGHEWLKATQEESSVLHGTNFLYRDLVYCLYMLYD